MDQIVHLEGEVPTEVVFEDKAASEQLKLIAQLNNKDYSIIMSIIDTMLIKQKFNYFFQGNIRK